MSRQRASAVLGCITVGFLACAVLLAPAAVATPESEAGDAITAAWTANGGDGGPLGPRNGDVYRVGDGFGANFAGGKIFFTPATGARVMRGAILEKYESLGGPADSDLGFPTIDEGPGRAPESLNTTFSATDKPVIFWTPATGARVVRGAINAAWDKLGGSSGPLGVPAEDEAYRGDVVTQKFTGGEVTYNSVDKTFTTVPPNLAGELAGLAVPDDPTSAINAARRAAGGTLGPLGAAKGEPYKIGSDGLGQDFARGKIFYTPATGAHVVTGLVLAKYESVGGPQGDLGFPTTGEQDGGLTTSSKVTTFAAEDKPVIFWTPDYGAVIVRGAMNAAWQKLDAARGTLGAPMADESENGEVVTQRFSGGVVSWDRSKGTFTTEPSNLAAELIGLEVPGQTPESPEQPKAAEPNGDKWFEWNWWWLLGLIPILVLIGLVVFATRRRHDDDDRFDDRFDDVGFGRDEAAAFAPMGAPEHSPGSDDYSAAMFGDRYAREGLGALSSQPDDTGTADPDVWGAPPSAGDTIAGAPAAAQDEDEDPDNVDTTPTRVPVERDPLTDTGRHARIEIDEPDPTPRTAFRLPLDDPDEAPEGYPIKADTRSGLYFAPGSALYDAARAEIWFASEEFARTNGFVPGE
ncbi:LGFP repeat-containing protein [Mycobacterium deserti]|uniref:LGFP repeat-containing protein n=1 Tax=Mycobacterium deserti TaxID=2978347 RepID=A0ABT2MEV3_9MYCO|nr:hypothetical protein [Mycobacterium deserti]MCT7659521.1 hypothetical protein [Mycobacterium deserti]